MRSPTRTFLLLGAPLVANPHGFKIVCTGRVVVGSGVVENGSVTRIFPKNTGEVKSVYGKLPASSKTRE